MHQSLLLTYQSDSAWATPMKQGEEEIVLTFSPKLNYQKSTPFHTQDISRVHSLSRWLGSHDFFHSKRELGGTIVITYIRPYVVSASLFCWFPSSNVLSEMLYE
jgi:hypothetical protein